MHPHFSHFFRTILDTPLEGLIESLPASLSDWEASNKHGHWPRWQKLLKEYPLSDNQEWHTTDGTVVMCEGLFTDDENKRINGLLRQFKPWRKGPYQIDTTFIDTEWRSHYKWDRLLPHITPLDDRRVLDVGCGSGYHMWRMLEAGAKNVVGIDPTVLFFMQFLIVKHFAGKHPVHFLPLGIEAMPASHGFDTVFSMGVFYHRKDPFAFLQQLKNQLAPEGELVLETLIIPGDDQTVLMPKDRYAQMSNVWFIPSADAMILWLERAGFKQVKVVDSAMTSVAEQRKTDWIDGHSLADFLHPDDPSLTIEGYPAPTRAVFIANK